mmetsp:Transcript_22881/g.56899  ORF Transcript_22881/g.56899 Transcript_22881/m.56899 type:complete len:553 (-) Transcript_22881:533-2191(-)
MLRFVRRVLGRVLVEDVVHQHCGHDRIGGVLLEDLVLEVGHAAVHPCERLVVQHTQRRGRGRHHRRHDRARLELEHGAPVLHPLCEGVVGPLGERDAVDVLHLLALARHHRRVEIWDEKLAAGEEVRQLLEAKRAEARAVVRARRLVRRVGADVDVGRCAQEGDAGRRACGAQPLDAVIGAERKLDVQLAVEVRVVPDDDFGRGRDGLLPLAQPIGDLRGLLHQVAAGALVHLLFVGVLTLRLGEREDERPRRILSGRAEAPPQRRCGARALAPVPGDVDSHDGCAHLQQLGEGPHRGARADHHHIHILEAAPPVEIVRGPTQRRGGVGLDDAFLSPLERLRLERRASEGLVGWGRTGTGGVPARVVRHAVALPRLAAAADQPSVERRLDLVERLAHAARELLVGAVEEHVRIHPVEAGGRGGARRLGALTREAHQPLDVRTVPEPPVALLGAPLGGCLGVGYAGGRDRSGDHRLPHAGGRSSSLVVRRELDANWRRWRLCESLLERALPIANHVEIHEGRGWYVHDQDELERDDRPSVERRLEGLVRQRAD